MNPAKLPKITDLVLFKVMDETSETMPFYLAAVVVKVWAAGVVNLHVFCDGELADLGSVALGRPCGAGADFKVCSVRYDEKMKFCWSWPS